MYAGYEIILQEELENGLVRILVDVNGATAEYHVFPEEIQ